VPRECRASADQWKKTARPLVRIADAIGRQSEVWDRNCVAHCHLECDTKQQKEQRVETAAEELCGSTNCNARPAQPPPNALLTENPEHEVTGYKEPA
jgi:hypothetical protein